MEIDILRGELERHFSLEEMLSLSRDLLGLVPEEIGATTSSATFARALVTHCFEVESLDALADAIATSRTEVDPKIREATVHGFAAVDEISTGSKFGEFNILRKLGEGPLGHVYVARKDEHEFIVKVIRSDVAVDRRRVRRLLTHARIVSQISHEGLPRGVVAGFQEGRPYISYEHVEGQTLASKIGRAGPMHLNEARPLLRAILEPLALIHEKRLSHGNLKGENVLLTRGDAGAQKIVLLDSGSDRLRRRARAAGDVLGMVVTPKIAAPELHRGKAADALSDVYAFGVLLYEVLTGKPLFSASTPVEIAVLHLSKTPDAPSLVAPRGWVSKELDTFVLSLLDKEPTSRPKDARALLEAIETLGRTVTNVTEKKITDEEVNDRIDALVAGPEDGDAALKLESAVEEGADPRRVADAFSMAAEGLDEGDDDEAKAKAREIKKGLLFRAARLFETAVKDPAKAEEAYASLVALDPDDDIALIALEEIRRGLGKYEELVEMLLARSERATSPSDRGRALAEIGRLYAHELDDRSQALIAYTQAFCEDPQDVTLASEIERIGGTDTNLWNEALGTITQATTADIPQEIRNALLIKLGAWYGSKISRPDLALTCFSAVVSTEPSNDGALEGMANIYRAAQQWPELGAVLLRRADISPSPVKARDLRAAAAGILDTKLNEPLRAKDIYETILSDDPSHEASADALARIYERTDDYAGLIKILERRADALRGETKAKTLVRIAEIYENNLNDLPEAVQRFEAALALDEKNLDALKGLDRVFNRLNRYKELLHVLERQLHLAATPRQKITLHERMAGIHDEEFLDHAAAALSYEAILEIDHAHENSIVALGRHYRALDRWEDVATLYDRHLKIVTDSARRGELLLGQARVLADNVGSPERAMASYEKLLEITPDHAGALEALARLREKSGDATAAISAIETLAEKATTPEAKAEQYMRAARLLESRGDRDGAIERFKHALDAHPGSKEAIVALRAAFAARGDVSSAIELIAREIEAAEGKLMKARLHGELARLLRERVKDDTKAAEAARSALDNDPTNPDALLVLGDIAFEAGRFHESAKQFESLASRVESLQKQDATRVLVRFIDSLAKTGSTEKAVASIDTLLRLAPDDLEAIGRVARVTLENGAPDRAYEINKQFYERFGDQLLGHEKTEALYRLGEAARRHGKLEEAINLLQDAADLDPNSPLPIDALAKVYADQNNWEEVIRIKNRRLDVLSGDERSEMLVEIGDIIANKLNDRTRAAKSFVAALEDRPDDRKLLTKLMQLYSEEKDWAKLVEIVLRLADFVDDKKQKAKYIHTAASISHKQLGDLEASIGYYDRVLELDTSNTKALTEATELRRERGDWTGVERLVKVSLRRAQESGNVEAMISGYDALGELYYRQLGWTGQAIDAFEAAQSLDPDNRDRNERLADMYASDPAQYLDKAVAAQRVIMRRNPHKPESYKLLRRLYTEAKRADSAWCLCQALYVLNLAEPDEERFFKRMRTENVAAAQDRLSDDDWLRHLYHEDVDPLLTSLFALIEPAILGVRAQPLESLGYDPRYQIDLALHPYPISQTLYYACGVLNVAPPPTFQNPNDMGGLSFLHAHSPSIVLGRAALTADVPTQAAAFLASRHLTFFRPGFYIRHLVPTGTGLKAWLFAAIKMIAPQFPIAGELEGPVNENMDALKAAFQGPEREKLASIVTKLLQGGGSLDLKKWVAAVDLTADRSGFILANDLELVVELIKGSDDSATAVPSRERLKELVLYAVSEEYFGLRDRLAIGIGA